MSAERENPAPNESDVFAGEAAAGEGPLPHWHPASLLATWFGVGRLPYVPGTWGSLAALPVAWLLHVQGGTLALAIGCAVVFVAGIWASNLYVRRLGLDDPGVVVVDEVAGQWLVLLAVPPDPWMYGLAFLVFRALDMTKPWPASWADRYVKGGFGVMLDDVLAALYGVAVMAVILRLWSTA